MNGYQKTLGTFYDYSGVESIVCLYVLLIELKLVPNSQLRII